MYNSNIKNKQDQNHKKTNLYSRSRNLISSFCWAAAAEAVDDAGADVVKAAAGQADAAEAGDDDEQDEESCDQPDPPDQSTLPVQVFHMKSLFTFIKSFDSEPVNPWSLSQ